MNLYALPPRMSECYHYFFSFFSMPLESTSLACSQALLLALPMTGYFWLVLIMTPCVHPMVLMTMDQEWLLCYKWQTKSPPVCDKEIVACIWLFMGCKSLTLSENLNWGWVGESNVLVQYSIYSKEPILITLSRNEWRNTSTKLCTDRKDLKIEPSQQRYLLLTLIDSAFN